MLAAHRLRGRFYNVFCCNANSILVLFPPNLIAFKWSLQYWYMPKQLCFKGICKFEIHMNIINNDNMDFSIEEHKIVIMLYIHHIMNTKFLRHGSMFLTHWDQDDMTAILQKIFSFAFSWMEISISGLIFHQVLFLWVQLIKFLHWFR